MIRSQLSESHAQQEHCAHSNGGIHRLGSPFSRLSLLVCQIRLTLDHCLTNFSIHYIVTWPKKNRLRIVCVLNALLRRIVEAMETVELETHLPAPQRRYTWKSTELEEADGIHWIDNAELLIQPLWTTRECCWQIKPPACLTSWLLNSHFAIRKDFRRTAFIDLFQECVGSLKVAFSALRTIIYQSTCFGSNF